MASIPDLMRLLCLDGKSSSSPLGGNHRTILIERDFTNTGDFVFSTFMQHFSRKEPNTPLLVIGLDNNWTHYSASAIKCGVSLRKTQNSGQIEFLDAGSAILRNLNDTTFNICDFISSSAESFIKTHSPAATTPEEKDVKPIIVMIDDIGALLTMGCRDTEIYKLIASLDKTLRERSNGQAASSLSHLIVQSVSGCGSKNNLGINVYPQDYKNFNHLICNLENVSDLVLSLKPLDTGFSTRVDGTIKIVDNRLPTPVAKPTTPAAPIAQLTLFSDKAADIGTKKAFFFKLNERRVRLTASALIF